LQEFDEWFDPSRDDQYHLANGPRDWSDRGIPPPGYEWVEAPYMFKHGEYYYLFTNWYDCCHTDAGYEIRVGRSKNPTGDFVDDIGQTTFFLIWSGILHKIWRPK